MIVPSGKIKCQEKQGRFHNESVFDGDLFKNIDPKRLLKHGFSITRDEAGRIITRANQVDKGAKIMVELAEGELHGEVI